MSDPSQPPRFVPTLTEVIAPEVGAAAPPAVQESSPTPESSFNPQVGARLEEALVQRVLQRVDLIIERRLREAVGQVILEHTESLTPRLREEIEVVVRQSLSQAFAQEMDGPETPT